MVVPEGVPFTSSSFENKHIINFKAIATGVGCNNAVASLSLLICRPRTVTSFCKFSVDHPIIVHLHDNIITVILIKSTS